MRTDNKNLTTSGSMASSQLKIRPEDAFKIASQLISQYTSPATPVREIIVNGIEANLEAKSDRPVKVEIEAHISDTEENLLGSYGRNRVYDSGVVTITDFGNGMTEEFCTEKFTSLGFSTKDSSDDSVGGFGIGSKSVAAYAKNAVWNTTNNGTTTTVVMSVNNDKFDMNITSRKSDTPNGTIVTIPFDGERISQIIERLDKEFIRYCDPSQVELFINGEKQEVGTTGAYGLESGDAYCLENDSYHLGHSSNSLYTGDIVVLGKGNVPYEYNVSDIHPMLAERIMSKTSRTFNLTPGAYVVRLDLAREHINPNRESLKSSDNLDSLIVDAIADTFNSQVESLTKEISEAKDFDQWRKAIANFDSSKIDSSTVSVSGDGILDTINVKSAIDGRSWNRKAAKASEIIDGTVLSTPFQAGYAPVNADNLLFEALGKNYQNSKYINTYLDSGEMENDFAYGGVLWNYYDENSIVKSMKSAWWAPTFEVDYDSIESLEDFYSTMFNASVVYQKDIRDHAKTRGREIVKSNPKASASKSVVASTPNPLNMYTSLNTDEDGKLVDVVKADVAMIRQHVKDNDIAIIIALGNGGTGEVTDIMRDVVKAKNILLVSGDKAYSRVSRSVNADKSINTVKVIDGGYGYYNWNSDYLDMVADSLPKQVSGIFDRFNRTSSSAGSIAAFRKIELDDNTTLFDKMVDNMAEGMYGDVKENKEYILIMTKALDRVFGEQDYDFIPQAWYLFQHPLSHYIIPEGCKAEQFQRVLKVVSEQYGNDIDLSSVYRKTVAAMEAIESTN